jgi:hypothetical protein
MEAMDISRANDRGAAAVVQDGAERAAALAESRRRATVRQLESAEAAAARRAAEANEFRDAAARAVGANTRVSITRAPSAPVFLYQAIDQATGEVVYEWPMQKFADLAGAMARDGEEHGLVVDRDA